MYCSIGDGIGCTIVLLLCTLGKISFASQNSSYCWSRPRGIVHHKILSNWNM